MGMTMTEKILAAHAGLDSVRPGQLIMAKPDLCMAHDASGPIAMDYYKEAYICSDDVLTIFRDYYSRPISNVSRAFIHKNGAYVAFDCVIEYITDEGEIQF